MDLVTAWIAIDDATTENGRLKFARGTHRWSMIRGDRAKPFIADIESGEIIEAGGFGTAAVVSPVGSYIFEDNRVVTVGDGHVGEHTRRLYQVLTDIQKGNIEGPEGWVQHVARVAQ